MRGPDVAFVRAERVPRGLPLGFIEGAPDLAIEIRSPRNTWPEILEKVGEYLSAGASSVWVVDAERDAAFIFEGDGVRPIARDGALEANCLPGFSLRLAELLAAV